MTEIHILRVRPHGAEQATRLLADLTAAHARGQDLGSRVPHIRVGGETLQELSVRFQNQTDDLEQSLGQLGLQDDACLAGMRRLVGEIQDLAGTAQRIPGDT